jgi:hypothetical protein
MSAFEFRDVGKCGGVLSYVLVFGTRSITAENISFEALELENDGSLLQVDLLLVLDMIRFCGHLERLAT